VRLPVSVLIPLNTQENV